MTRLSSSEDSTPREPVKGPQANYNRGPFVSANSSSTGGRLLCSGRLLCLRSRELKQAFVEACGNLIHVDGARHSDGLSFSPAQPPN